MKKMVIVAIATIGLAGQAFAWQSSQDSLDASAQVLNASKAGVSAFATSTGELISEGYEGLKDLAASTSENVSKAGTWSVDQAKSGSDMVSNAGTWSWNQTKSAAEKVSTATSEAVTSTYNTSKDASTEASTWAYDSTSDAVTGSVESTGTFFVGAWDASKNSAMAVIETDSVQASFAVSRSTYEKVSEYSGKAVKISENAAGVSINSISTIGEAILYFPSELGKALFESGDQN